jgi:hypothetical protein
VNKDLADVLGNFVSRITKFCRSKFGEAVPEGGAYGPQETALIAELATPASPATRRTWTPSRCARPRPSFAPSGSRATNTCNPPRPGPPSRTDPDRAAAITRFALNLIPFYAGLSAPFIPDAAAAMAEAMNAPLAWPESAGAALSALAPGHAFTVPEVLFAKIADEDREGLGTAFRGHPHLMAAALVSIETEGGIATVTLANPPVNALNHAIRQGLAEAVARVEADPDIRAVVLRGAGGTFIAGADIREFGLPPQDPALPDVVRLIDGVTKPWVAAIEGVALGGGLEIALGCSHRVAARTRSSACPRSTWASSPERAAPSCCPG